jgi:peptidoglycan/xylan/chitin deacetylase (PgdA/CDA1 family)
MFMMKNNTKVPTAKFVISIDTELAWGSIYDEKILIRKHESFLKTRTAIEEILILFEKYHISATWAIVGHLILKNCSKENGIKHPDVLRPNYSWFKKDWFFYDPCGRDEDNSIWYGDDIIKMIKECKIQQEIGSHSFSHIMFGDKGCSKACAESDIKKWVEVAELHGIKPDSFVFPFNSEGHHDILKQYGFKIYRSKNTKRFANIKNKQIKRIINILDRILALEPSTSKVYVGKSNLLTIHGDFCYFRYKSWRNLLMWKSAVRKSKKGIDRAIKNGETFHFWFHPFEVAANLKNSIQDLDEILYYVSKKMEDGLLENKTMNQLIV